MVEVAVRIHPLEECAFATDVVDIRPALPASRISLRAPAASRVPLSESLGLTLPDRPKRSSSKNGRHALWLGPDEWLVIDEQQGDLVGTCGRVSDLHAAVDVSHRNTAILVSGGGAEDILSAGCPQDLSLAAFPLGACSRTVLGKAEVVLYRTAEDVFRVEVWRSFSDYAFTLLREAARDL